MSDIRQLAALGLAALLFLALVPVTLAQEVTPVAINNEAIEDTTVTMDSVVSHGPARIVIHAQADGALGPATGYSSVSDGENTDVAMEIDVPGAPETLYAMLRTDAGQQDTYEFPGDDIPVQVDGEVVMVSFNVPGGLPGAPTPTAADQPQMVPGSGGDASVPWAAILLLVGGTLALSAGAFLTQLRQMGKIRIERVEEPHFEFRYSADLENSVWLP